MSSTSVPRPDLKKLPKSLHASVSCKGSFPGLMVGSRLKLVGNWEVEKNKEHYGSSLR